MSKTLCHWCALLLVVLLAGLLAGCDLEGLMTELEEYEQPTSAPLPTIVPVTARPGAQGTWTVLLYQDADDQVLERDIYIDLNEAELVGSTERVTIVAQVDRYRGAYAGDGNWTGTRRYLVTKDTDMERVGSQVLADLGELDMGDKQTLIDFASWAIQKYPAENYVLILSDHGAGWLGGWSDDTPRRGSSMRMQDIDEALAQILANTGIGRFELIGFDACLMGQLEVFSAVSPHARYAVASEETEPAVGWAYADFLAGLNRNPGWTGRELGQAIVQSYIDQDVRITDAAARRTFLGEMGADPSLSAPQVAARLGRDVTLAAVDLGAMRDVNAALNNLAVALAAVPNRQVAAARSYAQSYTSVFGRDVPPSYIDLGHFASLLAERAGNAKVTAAVQQLRAALDRAVIAEKHGPQKPASSGMALYFPNSNLYQMTAGRGAQARYGLYAGRFSSASLWDDYLAFHYVGKEFDPGTANLAVLGESENTDFVAAADSSAPPPDATVVAPGAGQVTIAPIQVSAKEISTDGVLTLATTVTGNNIGYIYYYVSYYSEEDNAFLTADMGFIGAEETREIDGIYYPDWGDEATIPIEIDWEPTLYFMSDGNEAHDQFAFFAPEIYGVTEEQDVYTVRGIYTFAASGEQREAVISFSGDGQMLSVFGFSGANGTGSPREIIPQAGDTFTIYEEWLEFENNPEGEFVDYLGGTMTFGKQRFTMVPYYAYAGQYTLGIIVEDMNGNQTAEFVEVTVKE